jgi:hypothetical protein
MVLPLTLSAQEVQPPQQSSQQPMSAIEWLNQNPAGDAGPVLLEPPVADTGAEPEITVSPLEVLVPPVGLVPASVTGLPVGMWQGSNIDTLVRLIGDVPVLDSPAMQALLYTLLLTDSVPPRGADTAEALLMARIDRLMALGAVDPAQSLLLQSDPTRSPARFGRWFDATLLTGDEDRACAILNGAPYLSKDYAARIFCAARGGDWSAAAVMLDGARALGLLTQEKLFLYDRFLNPDIYDGAPPLPPMDNPDPLSFRVLEAIGERMPTSALPRRFAVADLRDIAGWRAQLEAAERLARSGALSPNRLLGLYTARLPAASGGIWDRVEALQRFETALDGRDPVAVADALPAVWSAMQGAGLAVPFATLFAERLGAMTLRDADAARTAFHIRLLAPGIPPGAADAPDTDIARFLADLARGRPGTAGAPDERAQAIASGFANPATPPPEFAALIRSGQTGVVILKAMALFDSGSAGNWSDLSAALATFRALGLEDTARRGALQLMLLGPRGS